MNILRDLLFMVGITISGVAACNYTDGECYPRGAGYGSEGVGGTTTVSGGAGGFGDVPPEPSQDIANPPPECNIVSLSPCHEKCNAEDEARAIECAKIQDEVLRRACQDSSHKTYKSCREQCEQGATQSCDSKYQDCQNTAPFSCTHSIGGQSQCQRCWERCNAGDAPSATCRKCRF